MVQVGAAIPLVLQLFDGSTDRVVKANLFNPDGSLYLDDIILESSGLGMYQNNETLMPDVEYLACTYITPVSLKKVVGFHLYIIHQKFYDKFLNVAPNVHIDTAMDDLDGDYHFCYPFPAIQRAGFSANNMAVVNYNSVLKDEDIYGGKIHNL